MQIHDIEQDPPKIEFPCPYPVKVMGKAGANFQEEILEVISRHAELTSDYSISSRPSAKGNYISVTVVIEATGQDQLEALFADLMAVDDVKLVL